MQSQIQTVDCRIGNWRAEARVQEVEMGKLMAVISVRDQSGRVAADSQHTVVFDHAAGGDSIEETRELVQRLLRERYGI